MNKDKFKELVIFKIVAKHTLQVFDEYKDTEHADVMYPMLSDVMNELNHEIVSSIWK